MKPNAIPPDEVLSRIGKAGIIPVVVVEDPNKAVQLGQTLVDAGLDLIEITLRTERAIEAIRSISDAFPQMLVGAGTVFTVSKAREALSAGAHFIVSPHLDEQIVTYCVSKNVVCIPGVFTPSEVQRAIIAARRGLGRKKPKELPLAIKIFPASTGGPSHITAMRAVFPHVRFIPLGGLNVGNVAEYIKAGSWALGGTWICKKELIESNDFAKITQLVKEALALIQAARN